MTRLEAARPAGRILGTADTPRIEYRLLAPGEALPSDVMAAVTFGKTGHADPRCVRVGLEPLRGAGIVELWHASGPVSIGFDGLVRYSTDRQFLLGAVEVDERQFGGIRAAAEAAYAAVMRFQAGSAYPHLLRVWNYFDDINQGAGDQERYREFCIGRSDALSAAAPNTDYPAATAIGRRDGDPVLQVYWLAGRHKGLPLENPRQLSAYRYPRQYGPAAPNFSRAMLVADDLLMISGTASIIGHASHHPGNLRAQTNECLTNLESVLQRAVSASSALPPRLGDHSLLKVYLRDESQAALVDEVVHERLPQSVQYMILAADICRADLLVEFDCLHGHV